MNMLNDNCSSCEISKKENQYGAVTFVSLLYGGSTSDKEIVERCGFLNPKLWSAGDSVVTDRGFTTGESLKKAWCFT